MTLSSTNCPHVAFITVNWRSADVVQRLLSSLAQTIAFPYEAVVVNNDPNESAVLASVCHSWSCVSFIDLQRNVGFAAGCNVGAKRSTAPLLIFVNPDVCVHDFPPESLEELEHRYGERVLFGVTLQRHNKLLRGSLRRFPTFRRFLVDGTGLDRVFPFAAGSGMLYPDEGTLPRFASVEQPTGAFFGIGRKAFEELQGFDERFFVFFEEVDLALRASWEGIPIVKLPDVIAEHVGGHSTRDDRTIAIGLRWQSLRAFCAKHAPRIHLPPPWILITVEAVRFTLQTLTQRNFDFSVGRAVRISRRFGLDGV